METHHTSRRRLILSAACTVAVGAIFLLILALSKEPLPRVSEDGIPLPFDVDGFHGSTYQGSIVTIGRKNGITLRQIAFDLENEKIESVQGTTHVDFIDFVLTPNSQTISHGAPLCDAITKGKLYFGYKYTSRPATAEKQARDEALAGAPKTFSQLFPGDFFVSPEQRARDSYISTFETDKKMIFKNPCEVTLEKNARYILVVNDVSTDVRARDVKWCGNTVTESPEQCDDGNRVGNDGCSVTCRTEVCGNGLKEWLEQCDDGNQVNTDTCTNICKNPVCGDTFQQGTEQCDDGNTVNTDSCTNACTNAACGDTFKQGTEECDDGNQVNTDTCTNICKNPVCGDGFKQGTEQCDDANTVNTDACTNSCQGAACRDGIHQPKGLDDLAGTPDDEQCDDGNQVDDDACDNACRMISPF